MRGLALALVRLVDTLGVPTVVEGIETSSELDYVRALGADLGHGYHFSRPVAPDVMVDILSGAIDLTPESLSELVS